MAVRKVDSLCIRTDKQDLSYDIMQKPPVSTPTPPRFRSAPHRIQLPSPLNPNFAQLRSPVKTGSPNCISPAQYSPFGTPYPNEYFAAYSAAPRISTYRRGSSSSPRTIVFPPSPIPATSKAIRKDKKTPPKLKLWKVVHVYSAEDDASALRLKRDRQRRKVSTGELKRRPAAALHGLHRREVHMNEIQAGGMDVVLEDDAGRAVGLDGSGVYARRKEAKMQERKEGEGSAAGMQRRPSLPGINSLLGIVGNDVDRSARPSLTSATSFPDLTVLGGPLSSITPTSGSSTSYNLSPSSSGRLSHFSSLGFDQRASLDSSRSSMSGPLPLISTPWWDKEGSRPPPEEQAEPRRIADVGRKPSSFARFAFESERWPQRAGEGERRASERAHPSAKILDLEQDELYRHSRFESYPFESAASQHWSGDGSRRAVTDLIVSGSSSETQPLSRPSSSRPLPALSPGHIMPDATASRPVTPVNATLGIATAAALANDREREARKVSRQGSSPAIIIRDRSSPGPTFGPFPDRPRTRVGSLQVAPDALQAGSVYLWADEAGTQSGLPKPDHDMRYVKRAGSLTDVNERQGRSHGIIGRGGSLNASPSRLARLEKPYASRTERPYRPRMASIADAGMPEDSYRHHSSGSLQEFSTGGASHPRMSALAIDNRRESAIPPEGFAPVNRGHEEHGTRIARLEDADYPSVLRREISRATSGQSSLQTTPAGSPAPTQVPQAVPPTIMVPPGYTLTPVYAHPEMVSGPQPMLSPYYAPPQAGPIVMLQMGYPGQVNHIGPYIPAPFVGQSGGPGPSAPLQVDGRRDTANRDNQLGPRYLCEVCHKQFTRPSSLKIHMYSHTGEKPYRCNWPDCPRKFSVQSNLKRHAKVHLDNEAAAAADMPVDGRSLRAQDDLRATARATGREEDFDEEEEDELDEEEDLDVEMDTEDVVGGPRAGNSVEPNGAGQAGRER